MKFEFEKRELMILAKHIKGFRGYRPMFHAHAEIIYAISGSIDMVIDEKPRTLCAGELSITFPYSIHKYESSEDAEAIIILFSPVAAGAYEKTLLSHKPIAPYLGNAQDLYPVLIKMCKYAADSSNVLSEQITISYLQAVTGEILSKLKLINMNDTDLSTTQKLLIYCTEHYKEDISVKSVATTLYVSESTISKIFSFKLDCSFRAYINMLKINEAKKLLKITNLKILDIIYECGFQNQSSFNRVFYQECGITPKEYRERYGKVQQ